MDHYGMLTELESQQPEYNGNHNSYNYKFKWKILHITISAESSERKRKTRFAQNFTSPGFYSKYSSMWIEPSPQVKV